MEACLVCCSCSGTCPCLSHPDGAEDEGKVGEAAVQMAMQHQALCPGSEPMTWGPL